MATKYLVIGVEKSGDPKYGDKVFVSRAPKPDREDRVVGDVVREYQVPAGELSNLLQEVAAHPLASRPMVSLESFELKYGQKSVQVIESVDVL